MAQSTKRRTHGTETIATTYPNTGQCCGERSSSDQLLSRSKRWSYGLPRGTRVALTASPKVSTGSGCKRIRHRSSENSDITGRRPPAAHERDGSLFTWGRAIVLAGAGVRSAAANLGRLRLD